MLLVTKVSSLSSAMLQNRDYGSIPLAEAGMNQFKPIFLGQLEPNSPLQGALD
jgi:alanyl-tRNA synthetase